MSYNPELAFRIRKAVSQWEDMTDKKMFGGICHFLHGHIVCGIHKNNLVARIGVDAYFSALKEEHVLPFDITGRPMKGWVMVEPQGCVSDQQLEYWVGKARSFVETLPPKF